VNRNKLRAITATGAAAAVIGIAGLAWAAFFESTSTSANAASAEMVPLAVVGTPTVDYEGSQTALWPDHPADVVIVVKNNNEIAVDVTEVVNTGVVAVNGTATSCASYVQVSNPIVVQGGLPTVAGSGGESTLRLVGALTLLDSAPNTCQNGTFSTTWTVTGANA
jgi:hypothetical protein